MSIRTFESIFVSVPVAIDNVPMQLVLRDRKYIALTLQGGEDPALFVVCPRAVVRTVTDFTVLKSVQIWDEWTHPWELSPSQATPEWEVLVFSADEWCAHDADWLRIVTLTGRSHTIRFPRASSDWEYDLKLWLRGCADQNEESDRALARQDSIVKDILGTITQ